MYRLSPYPKIVSKRLGNRGCSGAGIKNKFTGHIRLLSIPITAASGLLASDGAVMNSARELVGV
jgi:hypothetical protein